MLRVLIVSIVGAFGMVGYRRRCQCFKSCKGLALEIPMMLPLKATSNQTSLEKAEVWLCPTSLHLHLTSNNVRAKCSLDVRRMPVHLDVCVRRMCDWSYN